MKTHQYKHFFWNLDHFCGAAIFHAFRVLTSLANRTCNFFLIFTTLHNVYITLGYNLGLIFCIFLNIPKIFNLVLIAFSGRQAIKSLWINLKINFSQTCALKVSQTIKTYYITIIQTFNYSRLT